MNSGEFAATVFPGVNPEPEYKQARIVVKERADPMTFMIVGGKVETLNGQAKQALVSVKDTPDRHAAFVYALILESEKIGRKVVMRVREDGARVQISHAYPDKK